MNSVHVVFDNKPLTICDCYMQIPMIFVFFQKVTFGGFYNNWTWMVLSSWKWRWKFEGWNLKLTLWDRNLTDGTFFWEFHTKHFFIAMFKTKNFFLFLMMFLRRRRRWDNLVIGSTWHFGKCFFKSDDLTRFVTVFLFLEAPLRDSYVDQVAMYTVFYKKNIK